MSMKSYHFDSKKKNINYNYKQFHISFFNECLFNCKNKKNLDLFKEKCKKKKQIIY